MDYLSITSTSPSLEITLYLSEDSIRVMTFFIKMHSFRYLTLSQTTKRSENRTVEIQAFIQTNLEFIFLSKISQMVVFSPQG